MMGAVHAREEQIARAMRELCISGRQLLKISAGWSVMSNVDRRLRARLMLEDHEVARLVGEDRLIAAGEDVYVLAVVRIEPPPRIEPWAYVMANKWQTGRHAGIGITALAIRACKSEGPLTMRHVQAGLRLIADAERRGTSHGQAIDWDSGPVDRQRRGAARRDERRAARDSGLRGAEAAARARAYECQCLGVGGVRGGGVAARRARPLRD